jgi:aminopeptidase N
VTLRLSQETRPTPDQPDKPPREIPVALALLGAESGGVLEERVVTLREASQEFIFGPFEEPVIPSLLRGFSAPVRLNHDLNLRERLAILKNETDPFSRWAIGEQFWRELCLEFSSTSPSAAHAEKLQAFTEAMAGILAGPTKDAAFLAELLKTPGEVELSDHVDVWDPEAIAVGRTHIRKQVATALKQLLLDIFVAADDCKPFSPAADDAGRRGLKNAALSLLVAAGEEKPALAQIESATNMTDEAAATAAIAISNSKSRQAVLERFHRRWREDPLVVNKWLGWTAMGPAETALADVATTLDHPAFDLGVPNKVRALIGGFSMSNPAGFHRVDGAGYDFFAERILQIDQINPQLAARLMTALESWRRLEPVRRRLAEVAIKRIASAPNLSPNVSEMASRLIGG